MSPNRRKPPAEAGAFVIRTAPPPAEDGRADPRVVVVVITHNRRSELAATLDNLLALPESPSVVVVDNGSTDGTAEMVSETYPEVTLMAFPHNLGATARNIGVAATETPYVAFCDDDTWYEPGALSRAADILDEHPRLAVVTAKILVEPGGRIDPICEEMAESPVSHPTGVPGHGLLSFLAGASVVRRRAFEDAGGFSKRLWLGGEEELLASDMARAGWLMSYVPEITAHHRPSRARDAHLRRRHGIRNTLWFTWLRRPTSSAIWRTVTMARTVPKDRISLSGFLDAARGIPWVLRERSVVPESVELGYCLLEESQATSRARRYVS